MLVVNRDGFTPLHFAASNSSLLCCKLLIKYGADTKAIAKYSEGMTPLDTAISNNKEDIIGLLLKNGGIQSKLPETIDVRPIDVCKTNEMREFFQQFE